MITVRASTNSPLTFNVSVKGLAVYLDNFAIKELAKGNPERRQRFVAAIRSGTLDLLFSVGNAAELSGPKDSSFNSIRSFLNDLEAHWFPVELDPFEVVNRERKGASPQRSCVCERFVKDFFNDRVRQQQPSPSGQIVNLSPQFFGLGGVMDWLGPQRDSIRRGTEGLDTALIARIGGYRAHFDSDRRWLDSAFPAISFTPSMPAIFTYVNLIRTLVLEAKSRRLKKGDGIDFCHAVMASAFASVGTLDKHWKRRIEGLPKPNGLARIYYSPELDQMIEDIEASVREVQRHVSARRP